MIIEVCWGLLGGRVDGSGFSPGGLGLQLLDGKDVVVTTEYISIEKNFTSLQILTALLSLS